MDLQEYLFVNLHMKVLAWLAATYEVFEGNRTYDEGTCAGPKRVCIGLAWKNGANIAYGDGRKSDFGTGFRYQVERALKRNWLLEIWSWSPTLNSCYGVMRGRFPNLSVNLIDPHYWSVTIFPRCPSGGRGVRWLRVER